MRKSLIAIVGPTASGKTGLAIDLAKRLDGEIVNADSRQVYRYMDIGTAKPTPAERLQVPHHLYDIVDPNEEFNVAIYQKLAYKMIAAIHERGKVPLLVGGSGQYVWAVLEGWNIPEVSPDIQIRRQLEARAKSEGWEGLFEELRELDPQGAEQIDPHNVRRVIRAIEVCRSSGRPFSEMKVKVPPDFDVLVIGIAMERNELYRRIDTRVSLMLEQGLVTEVKGLLERGYSFDLPAMSSLGYREIIEHLNGAMGFIETAQQIMFETHRFARHQLTWFRPTDERIRWLNSGEGLAEAAGQLAARWIEEKRSAG